MLLGQELLPKEPAPLPVDSEPSPLPQFPPLEVVHEVPEKKLGALYELAKQTSGPGQRSSECPCFKLL